VADLDKDGKPEILCGRAGNGLYCWDVQGNLRPGFPFNSGASAEGPIIVANIDGDPEMEILLDSNKTDASGKGWIYAIDHKGKLESGWPIQPQGVTYMNNCSVADVDGDGVMELAQISYSSQQRSSYVGLWKIAGSTYLPSKIQWWTYHENNPRTGLQHQGFRLTGSGPTTIGGAFTVQVKANPGNETYIALGITAIRQPLPPFGIFRLLPPLATLVYGIIPTTGTFGYNQPIPNIPALRGVTVYFQALEGMSVAAGHATFTDLLSITLR